MLFDPEDNCNEAFDNDYDRFDDEDSEDEDDVYSFYGHDDDDWASQG